MRKAPFHASAAFAALAPVLTALSGCADAPPRLAAPPDPPPAAVARAGAFRFPATPGAAKKADAPPIRLTASDGTGLRLASVSGRAVVEDPLAFTELKLVFQNPEDRVLEGTFSITLPPGASISRFSMRIGDAWQEGEIVERTRARQAYEDFLHRRQDPALLEQAAGNEFTARVFPIPARGVKEIVLSYAQEIRRDAPFALPLRGLPPLGALDVTVSHAGAAAPVQELHLQGAAPDADFVLDAKHLAGGDGLRHGDLVLARVRPMSDAQPDPLASAVILVDTSASRALDLDAEIRVAAALARSVARAGGPGAPLTVACYDHAVAPIYEGPAGAFGEAAIARIREWQALGASDLAQALRWAGERARAGAARRVVLLTDGVATAGEIEPAGLRAAAAGLRQAGVERLDAIALGGLRDDAALRSLVTAGLPRDGVVADGARGDADIERRLSAATRSGVEVKIDGARWIWPQTLNGVQPGDDVLVYAEVPAARPVRITVDGKTTAPELRSVERPLLERAWAQAKIDSLLFLQGASGSSSSIQKHIVELSVAHRVLSPYTAWLVLETERDYARFGIDRRSLADILTIDGGRIAVAKRSWPPQKAWDVTASAPAPAPGQAGGGRGEGIGLGRVGTLGHGASPEPLPDRTASRPAARAPSAPPPPPPPSRPAKATGSGQGFGSGQGRLGGAHATRQPRIRAGASQVSGRIPPEVIQRIVRQSFGRFRRCYEDGLRANPTLQGRIAVRFVIDPTGAVTRAEDAGSDLDARLVACVARELRSLSFPAPEGGNVTVVYPMIFSPGDALSDPRDPPSSPPPNAPPPPPIPPEPLPAKSEPYAGRFKEVMTALAAGKTGDALSAAWSWHAESPGDVMALVALGEALEAAGEPATAARCYGSLIDLFPSRADMRRFAGERLERLPAPAGLDLAIDTYEKAQAERPDHPASHRLLALARLRKGQPAKAFAAAAAGLAQGYPSDRFAGVRRILSEDLGLIAAAWIKVEPTRRAEILAKVAQAGGSLEDTPSLRFVLSWETDANDVDFHIEDDRGNHADYRTPHLPGGGELYADVTTGYGPECFTIRAPRDQRAARYTLQAHYYARGPMGYGMGKLEIIEHDGKGGLTFEERPFVVMNDRAFVDLGAVQR